jgi:hypothetical protein
MLSLFISDEIAVTLAISMTVLTWRRTCGRADRVPEMLYVAKEVCQVSSEKIFSEIWSGVPGIIRCNRSLKSGDIVASIHKIPA